MDPKKLKTYTDLNESEKQTKSRVSDFSVTIGKGVYSYILFLIWKEHRPKVFGETFL